MKWYEKTWKWLDGKKTVIGGAMVWASTFVKPHTVAYGILYYGGGLLGGTGVVHKIVKDDLGTLPEGVRKPQQVVSGTSYLALQKIKEMVKYKKDE